MQSSPASRPTIMRSSLEPKPIELDERTITLTEREAVARGKEILQKFLKVPLEAIATLPAERQHWNNAYLGWVPTPSYSNRAVRCHHGEEIDGWALWYHVDGKVYKVHMARHGEDDEQPPYRVCAEFILDHAARDLQTILKHPVEEIKKWVTAADAICLGGTHCFHVEAFCPQTRRKYLFLFRPDGERYNMRSDSRWATVHSRSEALKRVLGPLTNPCDGQCPANLLEMREFWYRKGTFDLAVADEEADVVPPEDPLKEEDSPFWSKAREFFLGQVFDSDEEDNRKLGPKSRAWLIRVDNGGRQTTFLVDQYGLCVQRDLELFRELKQWAANNVNRPELWEEWRIEDWYPFMLPNWNQPLEGLAGLCAPDLAAIATVSDGVHSVRVLVNLENRTMRPFS